VLGMSVHNFEIKISKQEPELGIGPKAWNIQVVILDFL
jgi:hypothetical protein